MENFKFDLNARRQRIPEHVLLNWLQKFAMHVGGRAFTTREFDQWRQSGRPRSSTIIKYFGSWKKALNLLGLTGVRQQRYTPRELKENLESVWQELGYPPGERLLARMGQKITPKPYKKWWGSVHEACKAISQYHSGRMTMDNLLAGKLNNMNRAAILLKDRWAVLKRDNYRCVKCGASPANDHSVELEVDHIVPASRGGAFAIDNYQTLCRKCNQGKKNKL